jgi:hypothetical protein
MKHAPHANTFRDAWAGDLNVGRCGTEVRVAGWVHRRRDHGGLIFIDLRDRSGLVQLVVHPQASGDAFALSEDLRPEHVISAEGEIVKRAPENVNPNLATGEIEIHVRSLRRLAASETPPFPVDEDTPVDEMIRLQHRMIDLRREHMREAMELRHAIVQTMRTVLNERDFLEIETPILTRSTPEGARDFLVPSRLQPGSWYALPQSPQLFKQLLMMSGYERYYQIARCFRDEDLRADRQPEFTQLDLEMAFVDEDDVIETMEAVMAAVFEVGGLDMPAPPWPRLSFDEAMLRFGSDRPDRRFDLEIVDVSQALRGSEFKVFESVLDVGGAVRAINAGVREMSRSELDGLNEARRWRGGSSRTAGCARRSRSSWARTASPRRRARWGRARATCCCSSPTSRASRRSPWARCASSSAGASGSSPRAATTSCGRSTSRCSSPPTAAGARSITRSPRREATSPIPARCCRVATTSSSTAGSSAAARSASTPPRSRSRSSRCSACPKRRAGGASASCSTR